MNSIRFVTGRAILCLVCVLGSSIPAFGQARPNVYVVAAGIDQYRPPTKNLKGCINDAVGMARVFQGQAGKRFGHVDAEVLTDAKATQQQILASFNALTQKGNAGDWYVLVLSGHGAIARNQWVFLAHDNRNISQTAILNLADRLASGRKKVIVIIDACYAGQLRYAASAMLNRYTDPHKGGIVLMLSSTSDQLSTALGAYSAFARAVEEGLKGMADYDNNEIITLNELRRFTFNRVYELCLKNRIVPGFPVRNQDSAIDASLSFPETTALAQAKKPPALPSPNEGPEISSSPLREKTWKVTMPAKGKAPAVTFELKLDPFGLYRATVTVGTRLAQIGVGAYKVRAKTVDLIYSQGTDRLQIVTATSTLFHFRFHGRDFRLTNDTPPPGTLLVDTTGRLDEKDPRDRVRKESPHKVYPVTLQAGTTYILDLQSPDFDAYLRLEDSGGVQVAQNDDFGGTRNSHLTFTPQKTEQYRVIVTTFRGGEGLFHLHVEQRTAHVAQDRPLGAGKVILNFNEQLTNSDPKDRVLTTCHSRVYRAKFKAGITYTIEMVSQDFDTYLRLEDDAGLQLAADDNSGGNRNARLLFRPTWSGTYRIVATSSAPATGRFTLTVQEHGNGASIGAPPARAR